MKPYEYWEWKVEAPYREWLAAWLDAFPFTGIEETPAGLRAYADPQHPVTDFHLPDFLRDHVEWVGKGTLSPRNWNALWEQNFPPLVINDVLIYAPFHQVEPAAYRHAICIEPAMAFGTGHHASTRLMLRLMRHLPLAGKEVIDWGCGTGILAIYAEKLGARKVWAVDNYALALDNTRHNMHLNRTQRITACGVEHLADIPAVDVILANIERNTLLQLMNDFRRRLRTGGHIAFSGIMAQDRPLLHAAARSAGFVITSEQDEAEWHAFTAVKTEDT